MRRPPAAWCIQEPCKTSAFEALRPLAYGGPREPKVPGDAPDVEVVGEGQDDARSHDVASLRRLGTDDPFQLGALGGGEADLDGADEGHACPVPEQLFLGQQSGNEFLRTCTQRGFAR
jgi:hypothetical protein